MAKQMVYFNTCKKIGAMTFHYNKKLDEYFVNDVILSLKEVSHNLHLNIDNLREYESIQVFIYPDLKLFNSVFGSEIEKRYYSKKRNVEDMYVVQDAAGSIHIVTPRGRGTERYDLMKQILIGKVLSECETSKDKEAVKLSAVREIKKIIKARREKQIEKKEEEPEPEKEPEEEEEKDIELDVEENVEYEEEDIELDEVAESEYVDEFPGGDLEQEITDKDIVEILETQKEMQEIKEEVEKDEKTKETVKVKKNEARYWLEIGWMAYVKGKLKKQKDREAFGSYISKKGITNVNKLKEPKLFEEYRYSEEMACATVEYILEAYPNGNKKLLQYFKEADNRKLEEIFGTTKLRFNNDMKAYIYRMYTLKEKEPKNIEVEEVTVIKPEEKSTGSKTIGEIA